jgi:hypothetical protein
MLHWLVASSTGSSSVAALSLLSHVATLPPLGALDQIIPFRSRELRKRSKGPQADTAR